MPAASRHLAVAIGGSRGSWCSPTGLPVAQRFCNGEPEAPERVDCALTASECAPTAGNPAIFSAEDAHSTPGVHTGRYSPRRLQPGGAGDSREATVRDRTRRAPRRCRRQRRSRPAFHWSHVDTVVAQCLQCELSGVGLRHRDGAQAFGHPGARTPSTHHPPSRARPSTAGASQQPSRAPGQQFGGDLRGVHPDLQHRISVQPSRRERWRAGRRSRHRAARSP